MVFITNCISCSYVLESNCSAISPASTKSIGFVYWNASGRVLQFFLSCLNVYSTLQNLNPAFQKCSKECKPADKRICSNFEYKTTEWIFWICLANFFLFCNRIYSMNVSNVKWRWQEANNRIEEILNAFVLE